MECHFYLEQAEFSKQSRAYFSTSVYDIFVMIKDRNPALHMLSVKEFCE